MAERAITARKTGRPIGGGMNVGEVQTTLVALLERGSTNRDACNLAGISVVTYYNWCNRGRAALDDYEDADIPESEQPYVQFLAATASASSKFHHKAALAIDQALEGATMTTLRTDTHTEVRLRKIRYVDKRGRAVVEEEPYVYTKTYVSEIVTHLAPDWHAGVEVLRRLDQKNWSDRTQAPDSFDESVKIIREQDLPYELVAEELGEKLATQLFMAAGRPLVRIPK